MTVYLDAGDNTYQVPMGEVSVEDQGGVDTLVLDYSAAGGPVVYSNDWGYYLPGWNWGWSYFSDEAMNTVSFWGFEKFDLTGGSESNDLRGGDDADRFMGGAGNDTIYSGLGADVIDGGAGARDLWVVDYSALGPNDVAIELLGGGATFTVAASGAQVSNIEFLAVSTGNGNDTINTSALSGNDNIQTGEGDDWVATGLGFDRVELGNGVDTLVMDYSSKTVDILHQHADDIGGEWYRYQDGVAPSSSVEHYWYDIEAFNLTGGSGHDTLSGRSDYDGNDRLVGNAGNDTLYGYGGVDTIIGGDGRDTWVASYDEINNNVSVNINTATQTASTGAQISGIEQLVIDTWEGDDTITAKAGQFDDVINTHGGADVITSGRGKDVVKAGYYGEGNKLVLNWAAVTTAITWTESSMGWEWYRFSSGQGDQIDVYGIDHYNIIGGNKDDQLRTFGGADTLNGGAGNDWLNSGTGKATIIGGTGTDYWEADVSAILAGVNFNAKLSQTAAQAVGAGHSIRTIEGLHLTTGNGNDNLNTEGYNTNDWVSTNGGNDTVSLGLGHDTAYGGAGTDTLVLDYSSLNSAITRTSDGYWYNSYQDALNTARMDFYDFEKFNLTGGSGNDQLFGASGSDTLKGGLGDDVLNSGSGKDTVDGGEGNDTWVADHSGLVGVVSLTLPATGTAFMKVGGVDHTSLTSIENVHLTTGSNADTINLLNRTGNHNIDTGNGNDAVKLGSGLHNAAGGSGNDVLVVNFSSSTTSIRHVYNNDGWYRFYDTEGTNAVRHTGFEVFDITGGSGNDRLSAWGGDDKLNGGAGNDVLTGGAGNDVLTGGTGNDIFVFGSYNNGLDTITDAVAGDIIRVNEHAFVGEVTEGNGVNVGYQQVQLEKDTVNHKTTLYIGSDDTAGADTTIVLLGDYETSAFTLSGKDILVTAGITNTPGVGNDTVPGTAGNDELYGGDGNDLLQGRAGNDVLDGGTGDDTLNGGLGVDTLTGGEGADVFQYSTKLESAPGTIYHDVIEDFVSGVDKIDLSAIDANPVLAGNQAFKFITTDFTGVAGQVRYSNGLVLADVNGDGMTDIEIALTGVPAIAAGDFVL